MVFGSNIHFLRWSHCSVSLFIHKLPLTVMCFRYNLFKDKEASSLFWTMMFPLPVILIATTFCYLRTIALIKKQGTLMPQAEKAMIKNLYRYSFVQLLTVGP